MTRAEFINSLRGVAEESGVFASVKAGPDRLVCEADGTGAPAEYRVEFEGSQVWVSLSTKDRWLSESIESDLLHTGDKLGELLEEEMIELGYDGPHPTFEHFRSEALEFVFRTPVRPCGAEPDAACLEAAVQTLLGYEACFRNLGDMSTSDE